MRQAETRKWECESASIAEFGKGAASTVHHAANLRQKNWVLRSEPAPCFFHDFCMISPASPVILTISPAPL
jgi:hypothetical protein